MAVARANKRGFRIETVLEVDLFTFQVRYKGKEIVSIAD